jgi:cytochrome c553
MSEHMKVVNVLTLAITGLLGAAWVHAADNSPEITYDALRVAVTTCATCHGRQGRSISPKFPNLAGQHASYLIAQLHNFKQHGRGDADAVGYMWGMAEPLSEDLISGLAEYYSKQTPASGKSSNPAEIARGKTIYENGIANEGIPACAACHGPNAAGTEQFPRLAGQSAEYVLKQLGSFQSNLRDVAVMHGVASELKKSEMSDTAAYLQSLGP